MGQETTQGLSTVLHHLNRTSGANAMASRELILAVAALSRIIESLVPEEDTDNQTFLTEAIEHLDAAVSELKKGMGDSEGDAQ